MNKIELRKKIKTKISTVDRATASKIITDKLKEFIPESGFVLAFEPLKDEPDISEIIEQLKAEKRFAFVSGVEDNAKIEPQNVKIELAIIPGRAFDIKGYRLGRGGGTFDRILSKVNCKKIGTAFDCQLLESIPKEPHDQKVNIVVTESRIKKL